MTTKNTWRIVTTGAAAALLVVGAPLTAHAVVSTEAYVDNSAGTWDSDPIIANLSGDTTVAVSGEGFDGYTFAGGAPNGVYIAFGGEDFTSQDSGYYYSAVWAQPDGTTTTATRVPLDTADGSFADAQIVITQAYDDVDCLTSAADTSGEQCYIYTFSGWGAYATESGDPNFTKVPVYFE